MLAADGKGPSLWRQAAGVPPGLSRSLRENPLLLLLLLLMLLTSCAVQGWLGQQVSGHRLDADSSEARPQQVLTPTAAARCCFPAVQYKDGSGNLSVGDVLIQIAAERGHKTVLDENRAERLSESEGEDAASKHGQNGSSSNGSNSAKASNVTSFAVDDFSDSEDSVSVSEEQGSMGGSEGGSTAAAAAETDSSSSQQQQKGVAALAAAGAAAAKAATGGTAVSVGGELSSRHRHKKRHHHSKEQQEKHSDAVGVMLDVSQHGHVSVVVVPGDI